MEDLKSKQIEIKSFELKIVKQFKSEYDIILNKLIDEIYNEILDEYKILKK